MALGLLGGSSGGSIIGGSIVRLFLDTKEFDAALARSKGETQAFGASSSASFSKFGMIAKAAFVAAGVALVAFGVAAVKAAQAHQAALAQLTLAAGANTQAYVALAAAQVNLTGFTQDATIAAETQLARFGLNADQMRQIIPLVEDYARATGTDAVNAATNVSKALLGQARALKAVGIDFKATGNAGDDFNTIVSDLQTHVGGAAAAFLGTYQGKLALLGAQFDALKISVGDILLPVLERLLPIFSEVLNIIVAFRAPLLIALGAFVGFKIVSGISAAMMIFGQAVALAGGASAAAGGEFAAAGLAIESMLPGIGLAIAALSVITLGMSNAHAEADKFASEVPAAIDGLQRALGLGQIGINAFNDAMAKQRAAADLLGVGLDKLRAAAMPGLIAAFQRGYLNAEQFTHQGVLLGANQTYLANVISGHLTPALGGATSALGGLTNTRIAETTAIHDEIAANLQLAGGMTGILSAMDSARTAEQALAKARGAVARLTAAGKTHTQDYHKAVQALTAAQHGALSAQLAVAGAVETYKNSTIGAKGATKDAVAQIKTFGREANLTKGEIRALVDQVTGGIQHIDALERGVKKGADTLKGFANQGKETRTNFDWATGSMGKFGDALSGKVSPNVDAAKTKVDALGRSILNLRDKTVTISLNVVPDVGALPAYIDGRIAAALSGLKTP